MMPGARGQDRRFWLVCLAAGVLILVGCLLPTIEVGQGAFIGAGDTQRSLDYDRSIRFATYSEPGALLFVLGAIGLMLIAAAALVRGSTPFSCSWPPWCRSHSSSKPRESATSCVGRQAGACTQALAASRTGSFHMISASSRLSV
jgi:hypothetical protein